MGETCNYTVNYWYDDQNEYKPFEYVLVKTETFEGTIGDTIETVEDYSGLFYFKTKDNLPLTLVANEKRNVINVYYTGAYRNFMYKLMSGSITQDVSRGDSDVFFRLLACLYGDLFMQAANINDVINIDETDEVHLRHLAKLVNYPWSEALTADQQRESIKFYILLRKMRGTSFALTNLIRIFGQKADTLYQPTDNTGVRIIEYYENNPFDLFPGDIRVEIPELSQILRDAIDDVKLMGTRLIFAYRIPVSTEYKDEYGVKRGYRFNVGFLGKITSWLQPGFRGWDKPIEFEKKLNTGFDNKIIYKYRDTYKIHGSFDVVPSYSREYENLWLFQEYGLHDVRGVVLNDGVIDENLFLYR